MIPLDVPKTDASVLRHSVETRPRPTRAWLDQLPYANPVEAARKLVMGLYALNRQPLAPDDRHALLALYGPAVGRVAAGLEALLGDAGVPPHAQQRQAGGLLRELHTEFAYGHKHVLLALGQKRFGRPSPKRLTEALTLLLGALHDTQTAHYLTFTALPRGLWRELHGVHALAQTFELADAALNGSPSPGVLYRRALLLDLADPPHMNPGQFAHARLYLERYADRALLGRTRPTSAQTGFVVPADADLGPLQPVAAPPQNSLWLDTAALCAHLQDTALLLGTGDTPRKLGLPPGMESEQTQALFTHLLKMWQHAPERAFKRHPANGEAVEAVAGVSAIHRLFAQPAPETDDDVVSITDALGAPAPTVEVVASAWTLCNDSAAGLALKGTPQVPLNLTVGEPLALRTTGAAEWSLAVIRWLRMPDAREVELGIERLAPRIEPAWITPRRGHRRGVAEPALFVPGIAALKQPDRLLLPHHLHEAGLDGELRRASGRCHVRFGSVLVHTSRFDLVEYTVLPDDPAHD